MRLFDNVVPFAVVAFVAGCGGDFTVLGETGSGGKGGTGGTAGTSTSGTAGAGTAGIDSGSGATAGMNASGGTGGKRGNGGTGGGSGDTGGSSETGGKGGSGGVGGSGAGGSSGMTARGGSGGVGAGAGMGGSGGTSGSGGMSGYDPCAAKSCGEECSLCDPSSGSCSASALVTRCDADGSCSANETICPGTTACSSPSDCQFSGQLTVTPCPDGSTEPTEYTCVGEVCSTVFPACPMPSSSCAGKSCGDSCQAPCTGGPGNCAAPIAYCDANLTCRIGSQPPTCGVTPCQTDDDCGAGHVCVNQIGGAGNPGGFQCAVQDPCGSSDPCACIHDEGTCTWTQGSPGYCQCDNGIR